MSEMKPLGYIHHSATQTLRDRALCNSTITKKATASSDMPLYTSDQLAEAVAAEREKNDALIRDLRKELNERRYGRSAAK